MTESNKSNRIFVSDSVPKLTFSKFSTTFLRGHPLTLELSHFLPSVSSHTLVRSMVISVDLDLGRPLDGHIFVRSLNRDVSLTDLPEIGGESIQ